MSKIIYSDLDEIFKINGHGGSWSSVYSAKYQGRKVLIKAQDCGSLKKTDSSDDRFIQALTVLKMGLPECVSLIGDGDDFLGERFVVLEKLFPLTMEDQSERAEEIVKFAVLAHRKLYIHNKLWVASVNHIMKDINGNLKTIDFNDDQKKDMPYIESLDFYGVNKFVSYMSDISGQTESSLFKTAFDNMIKMEYQSLENVHQPIYFKDYGSFLRTETERDDPNFLKLVSPNRLCSDRAAILEPLLENVKSVLDIGCNVGWFCFWMAAKGIDATGIDFDAPGEHRPESWKNGNGGKIDFANMVGELEKSQARFLRKKLDIEYASGMPHYDLVMALSILHLLFTHQKMEKAEWVGIFKAISDKADKILIVEVSEIMLSYLGEKKIDGFMSRGKEWGNFQTSFILGKSEIGRNVIVFKK